jgi:CheY-like chemotaxis protein
MNPSSHTLLLVDDDDVSNYITRSFLEQLQLPCQVEVYTDGEQALQRLRELAREPKAAEARQIMLLDLVMPVLDGFELLDAIQENQLADQMEVFILSSSNQQRDLIRARQYPIAGYIQKPITAEQLRELCFKQFNC